MATALGLVFLFASAQASAYCERDVIPDMGGSWLCNPEWIVDSSNQAEIGNLMDGQKNTYWSDFSTSASQGSTSFVAFRLPDFYVVRGIKLRSRDGAGSVKVFRLSYWDDATFQDYAPGDVNSANWIKLNDFTAVEKKQVFGNFSQLSRYWKVTFLATAKGEAPTVRDVSFFVVAGVAAMNNGLDIHVFAPNTSYRNEAPPLAAPAGDTCANVVSPVPRRVVQRHRLDTSFYRKHTSAYGVPIMGSLAVDDRALQRACYVVRFMLADRRDLRDHMYTNLGRVAIIGRRETVPMVPEMREYYWWTRRAAGGTYDKPVNVGAEENMLCERQDGYAPSQDIFMHELAHGIHLIAAHTAIPDFNSRLQASFIAARRRGLWRNTYANTDNREYFAEGVQAYFNQQREGRRGGDGIQNHVNTREELKAHDFRLYKLVEEIFPCSNPYVPRCSDLNQSKGLSQKLVFDCGSGGVVVTPTPAPGCRDDHHFCPAWKQVGECETSPSYMLDKCKLSCGVCGLTTVSPATSTPLTSLPATATVSTTSASTTTIFPPDCEDDHFYCAYWSRIGECRANPGYMMIRCKKSCKACAIPTTTSATTEATTHSKAVTTGTPTTEKANTAPDTTVFTSAMETSTAPPTSFTPEVTTVPVDVTTAPDIGSSAAVTNTTNETTESATVPPTAEPDMGTTTGSTSESTAPVRTTITQNLTTASTEVATSIATETATTNFTEQPTVTTTGRGIETTTITVATSTSNTVPTTGPPTPAPACEDSNFNCGYWRSIGECQRNPTYMLTSCRKSCGNCAPPTGVCVDRDGNCANWRMYCYSSRYVFANCRRTCGRC